jgi:hypothetical protein
MTYLKQMELGHEVGHNVQVVTTLEEAAENYVIDESYLPLYKEECKRSFTNGANWQAERMYSEEDMKLAWEDGRDGNSVIGNFPFTKTVFTHRSFTEWFEQHKNK